MKLLCRLLARAKGERWRLLSSAPAELGECPRWLPDGTSVYWIDIPAGVLHRTDVVTHATRSWTVGREIAALVISGEGEALAWVDGSIRRLDQDGRTIADLGVIPGIDQATMRANDASWAPDGSLWITSMARDGDSALGGVTRFDPPSAFSTIVSGIAIGNGPVFDSTRRVAYVADSKWRRVLRLALDATPDPVSFFDLTDQEGYPDGMAVDRFGNLWLAHYGAARISVWSPEGVRLRTIATPFACPTAIDLHPSENGVRAAVTCAAAGGEAGGLWGLTMPWVG